MNTLFLLCTMFLYGLYAPMHDVPIAIFHITESDNMLEIDITIDLEDFCKSIDISSTEVTVKHMQNYLTKNTSFQFNSKAVNVKISETKIVRDHIEIKGSLGKKPKTIHTIKIENTCLNNVLRHSNVIQIDLNNMSKDYRMHTGRTVINLEY